jgi:hypothetical protein
MNDHDEDGAERLITVVRLITTAIAFPRSFQAIYCVVVGKATFYSGLARL